MDSTDDKLISYAKHLKDTTDSTDFSSASMEGFSKHLKQTGKMFDFAALKAGLFNAALNAGVMYLVSWGIQKLVTWLDDMAHSAERCAERVDELMSSYKSALDKANKNAKTVEGLAEKYEKLSRGVDNLGKNLSLTTDEYSDYNNIVNQIADMFPQLISGYTDEGNAILSLKGNVTELTNAYKEAQQEAYNMLTATGQDANGNDILQNWKNTQDTSFWSKLFGNGIDSTYSKQEAIDYLQDFIKSDYDLFRKSYDEYNEIERRLQEAAGILKNTLGVTFQQAYEFTDEEIGDLKRQAKILVQTYQAEIDTALNNVQSLANAYLQTNVDYAKLDSETKNAASVMVNSLNAEIASGFEDSDEVGRYVDNIVEILTTNSDIKDALVGLLQLDTSKMSISDIEHWVNKYTSTIAAILEKEDQDNLKIRLGFDEIDDLVNSYNEILLKFAKQASSIGDNEDVSMGASARYDEIYARLDNFATEYSINTQDEIAAFDKALEKAKGDINKAFEYYLKQKSSSEEIAVFSLSEEQSNAIDDFQSKVKSLKDALDALHSGSFDSSALIDLQQEFPELQTNTENLEQAIGKLIDNALQALYGVLGEEVPDNLKNSLQSIADEANGLTPALDQAFSSVQSSYSALNDFKESMSEGITDSVLSSVASLSGSLNDLVAGFYAGAVSAEDLFNSLTEHYNTDLRNYSKALIVKNQLSDTFYNNILLADVTLVNQFKDNYGIDLQNCKNYAKAKEEIEKACFQNVSGMWTDYYNAQTDTFQLEYGKLTQQIDHAVAGSEEWDALVEQRDAILEGVIKYRKASEALNNIAYHGIEANFDTISSKISDLSEKKEKEPTETVFNWIEVQIQRTEEAIDRLNKKLASVSDYTSQNAYIDDMLASYDKELDILEQSKQKYLEYADAVGLSAAYIEKIKNGSLEIQKETDEVIVNKIQEYQEWYEKSIEIENSIEDITQKIRDLNKQKLDNLINDFERVTSLAEAYKGYLQALIDVKEAKGENASESDYNTLIQKELDLQATLQEQYQLVQAEFNKLNLSPSDDEWYEYQKDLVEIQTQIEDCTVAVEEFKDAILELRWDHFEKGIDTLANLSDEISDVMTLLGDGAAFKDGEITDTGITKIGLYAQQYGNAKQQIAEYGNAIQKLGDMYRNGDYSLSQYNEKLAAFQSAQRDAALSANDARKAILKFHREAIENQIDSMKELIDSKKKALDSERDLYEYQKSIANKQKAIQSLEKKIATLALSDAREDNALKLQLEEELAKQREELADLQRDHSIESQKEALDQQYNDFEKEKNDELDELESNFEKQNAIIEQYLAKVEANYDIVYDNIQQISNEFGIEFTQSLTSPWESATNAAQLYAQAVDQVMAQLQIDASKLQNFSGTSMGTTMNTGNQGGEWIQETDQNSENYGKWWYKHADGSYTTNGWENIDGKWYAFDKDGWMGENEWLYDKNLPAWYYVGSDGAMVSSGWQQVGDKWYDFDDNGVMKTNEWIKGQDGKEYYVTSNGDMATNSYVKGKDGTYYWVNGEGMYEPQYDTKDEDYAKQWNIAYEKGTHYNPENQYALVDECGPEIIMRPDKNGRVKYIEKGASVIPADASARIMNIVSDPASFLKTYSPVSDTPKNFEAIRNNAQPVELNITSPLIHVEGGLDSSIMAEVDRRINKLPDEIVRSMKTRGIK